MHARQLVDAFLLHRRASGVSPKTLEWHHYSLQRFLEWMEGNDNSPEPSSWTAFTIRSYVASLQSATSKNGKPLSGHSITSYTSSVLAFLKWLHEEEITPTNLSLKVKKPKLPDTIKEAYSDDEVRRLMKAATTLRDQAILHVLLDCGLRASELCSLDVDNVLMDQQMLVVRCGKGRKDRVVPMSYKTAKVISRYLMKRNDTTCILFLSEKGGYLQPNSLRQLIERLAERASVEKATVHRFRRTFATMYLRNGGDLATLKHLMGHADLTTTMVYLHITNEDLQKSHASASPLTHLKN